jgi:hypothetical protein
LARPFISAANLVAVDGEVGGAAQPHVAPGRALGLAEMVVPDVRRHVLNDSGAALAQPGQQVGRRVLDEVELAGEQCVGARHRLGRDDEDEAVHLRHPRRVPVGGIAHQLRALPRDEAGEAEGAGARGFLREAVPVAAQPLELRRRGDQEPQHLVGEEAVHRLGGDFHRHVVELAVGGDGGQARADLGGLAVVEMRRLGV